MTYCIEVWGCATCASQTQLNCSFLLKKNSANFSYYLAHTNPLFLSMEVLPHRKIFCHGVGLVMYIYSNHLLPECIAQLYLRNDSNNEHNKVILLFSFLLSKIFHIYNIFLILAIMLIRFFYISANDHNSYLMITIFSLLFTLCMPWYIHLDLHFEHKLNCFP